MSCATRHVNARGGRQTREVQILALAALGYCDEEMGERLGIKANTVGAFWKRALARFGSRTRTEAVANVLLLEILRLREQIAGLRAERDELRDAPAQP